MLAAQCEQGFAPRDVRLVAQSRVPRLELELGDVRRIGVNVVLRRCRAAHLVHGVLGAPRPRIRRKTDYVHQSSIAVLKVYDPPKTVV